MNIHDGFIEGPAINVFIDISKTDPAALVYCIL